jgi:hypothetical protein
VIHRLVACLAAYLPQSFLGSLVPWIEGQYLGQVGQSLAGIGRDGSPLQPRFHVVGIQFQDSGKIALGTGALAGPSGLHASFHEDCDLFLYAFLSGSVGRQMDGYSPVGLRSS